MNEEFESKFVDDTDPDFIQEKSASINKIDSIYELLQRDYEERGFQDSYINHDLGNAEENLKTIFIRIKIQIDRVRLSYIDLRRNLDFHISVRSKAAMVDIVEELASKRETVEEHLQKLDQFEKDISAMDGLAGFVRSSYMRGFKRGLVAISRDVI